MLLKQGNALPIIYSRFHTWGIIDNLLRRSLSPISVMHTPSILITPSGSARRKNAEISDDLPAPVRPTIPT